MLRYLLKEGLPRKGLFSAAMMTGQQVRSVLPAALRNKVPPRQAAGAWPSGTHARKMILLDGCVQPSMAPNINAATARVLDALGVQVQMANKEGCCGALRFHMNEQDAALDDMRRNIDAWWPLVEAGAEALIMTASGCGVTVKEYGHLLRHDTMYADKAKRVSEMTRDVSEVLLPFEAELMRKLKGKINKRVAYHPPCTLQHGQKIRGTVEALLRAAGVDVQLCADSHLCCGSAGTYSVLHPQLAYPLRDQKLKNLLATQAEMIVSANIGCQTHLQSGTDVPVRHWIELIDSALA